MSGRHHELVYFVEATLIYANWTIYQIHRQAISNHRAGQSVALMLHEPNYATNGYSLSFARQINAMASQIAGESTVCSIIYTRFQLRNINVLHYRLFVGEFTGGLSSQRASNAEITSSWFVILWLAPSDPLATTRQSKVLPIWDKTNICRTTRKHYSILFQSSHIPHQLFQPPKKLEVRPRCAYSNFLYRPDATILRRSSPW